MNKNISQRPKTSFSLEPCIFYYFLFLLGLYCHVNFDLISSILFKLGAKFPIKE